MMELRYGMSYTIDVLDCNLFYYMSKLIQKRTNVFIKLLLFRVPRESPRSCLLQFKKFRGLYRKLPGGIANLWIGVGARMLAWDLGDRLFLCTGGFYDQCRW